MFHFVSMSASFFSCLLSMALQSSRLLGTGSKCSKGSPTKKHVANESDAAKSDLQTPKKTSQYVWHSGIASTTARGQQVEAPKTYGKDNDKSFWDLMDPAAENFIRSEAVHSDRVPTCSNWCYGRKLNSPWPGISIWISASRARRGVVDTLAEMGHVVE